MGLLRHWIAAHTARLARIQALCATPACRPVVLSRLATHDATCSATPTDAPEPASLVKRRVALHVAYTGTDFQGLQVLADLPNSNTVEAVLEAALFKAGYILPSNHQSLYKSAWSRSSRTDKGVHSLATVVSLKLECPAGCFDLDVEGQALAQSVNAFLPGQVRVLSAQRVNKRWNARFMCQGRAYRYYLPARLLSSRGQWPADEALERFQAALAAMQGTRPFHNFTRRSLYRPRARVQRAAAALALRQGKGRRGDREGSNPERSMGGQEEGLFGGQTSEANAGPEDFLTDKRGGVPSNGAGGCDAGPPRLEQAEEGAWLAESSPAAASTGDRNPWQHRLNVHRLSWEVAEDPADRVSRAHFRTIRLISAREPAHLVVGAPPCVEVAVEGDSFMVHQIRHMVGAATAIARGMLPLAWLEAALCVPARATLPLAPPQGLVLTGCKFKAPPAISREAAEQRQAGKGLELRAAGQAAQDCFFHEVLAPELARQLASPTWDEWEGKLQRIHYSAADMAEFLARHCTYAEHRSRVRRRDAEQAAALAAARSMQS